ncbi:MAG: 5'/3'-nucleotidase SurE [Limnochordales bacterium]|mgnify:CR=1 FL=1|nr:MAG: 5'/3'-nucleotidase SurE [Bacillota bacterium]
MRVLITNDDGIRAPGIQALVEARPEGAEVWVMAPDRERSATGQAITIHKPLRVDEVPMGPGVKAFQLNGTPSDCVKVATALMDARPDIVLSGINRGSNLGTDVMYSGTVSGAIEAAIYDFPAIALSLDDYDAYTPDRYETAAAAGWRLARLLVERPLAAGTVLNVNVPAGRIRGWRATRLGLRRYRDVLHRRFDPRGKAYYWMAGEIEDADSDDESIDTVAVRRGYISVTPITFDLTNYGALETVETWVIDTLAKSPDAAGRAPSGGTDE